MSQSDEERRARRRLYKTPRWRRTRARQLRREPNCRSCALREVRTQADHVDHVTPVPEPVMRHLREFWTGELQSLCRSCHTRKTSTERTGAPRIKGCDDDGTPVDPNQWIWR